MILFAEILNTIPAKIAGIPITNRLIPKLLMPPCENKIACRDKPQAMAVIACVPSIIPTSPVNRRWVLVPKIPGTCRREPKKKTPASIAIFGMESSSVFASVKKSKATLINQPIRQTWEVNCPSAICTAQSGVTVFVP